MTTKNFSAGPSESKPPARRDWRRIFWIALALGVATIAAVAYTVATVDPATIGGGTSYGTDAGLVGNTKPEVTLSIDAMDALAYAAHGGYNVNTSGWNYNTNACDAIDAVIAASFTGPDDVATAHNVRSAFGPSGPVKYTLQMWMDQAGKGYNMDEVVQAAYSCADWIATQH